MRKLCLAITFLLSLALSAAAQVKPNAAANNHSNPPKTSDPGPTATGTRTRYSQPTIPTSTPDAASQVGTTATPQWGNAPLSSTVINGTSSQLTETYRVGKGDILDIRLPGSMSTRSTLYTVSDTGMIDYPLASGPVQVAGLTTDAIAARLKATIRVIDAAPIMVKVRDFASHSANIIGFVQSPGSKILRREAVPLYVLLAEAAPLKEALSATVVRNGQNIAVLDLHNVAASNQLILHGDVVKVSDRAVSEK